MSGKLDVMFAKNHEGGLDVILSTILYTRISVASPHSSFDDATDCKNYFGLFYIDAWAFCLSLFNNSIVDEL